MATEDILNKPYNPKDIEEKWYDFWMQKKYFVSDNKSKKPPYVIMMPPPNITGALHLGHALTAVIQDVLIRWKRMSGFNTLWLPGSDHAGIATQTVVEKELAKEGLTRHQLGREKFLERVWQWREQYGRTIMLQERRFGNSCDWTREHFTMDEDLSRAVRYAFVSLYKEGLIYRGNYLINWCPRCQSALSDLEVNAVETPGKLWYLKYPVEGTNKFIVVATTRPETMLGDTAVAINPKDKKYKEFVGKKINLPLIHRMIPIIEDSSVDSTFGSGAVKITPAHDFNDFELGKRYKLEAISIFDEKAHLNEITGPYKGLDRFKAREKILEDLKERYLLEKEENYTVLLGHCQRCDTIVEPRLSMQWFVKTKPLAKRAIQTVRAKKVKIVPSGWTKTYFNWMENIKDWCISRQIWWGHRIPAWYCDACGKTIVSIKDPKKCEHCKNSHIHQDTDVLDTWFSSALWPFSTLGWPNQTRDLKVFYPSTVMETGFDILFFWVARMMMMGLHFMKKSPFKHIYLHAMVRDLEGKKMSKTRGNVVDPLDIIEEFGADALRFTLASLAAPGRDIKFSEERVQGYRNFMNKIWNATRFVLIQVETSSVLSFRGPKARGISLRAQDDRNRIDKWILTRFYETVRDTQKYLEEYRLDEAAKTVYHFTWHEFCDWYIELTKQKKEESQETLLFVLSELLKLLHPFSPFITEELWRSLAHVRDDKKQGESIMNSSYPKFDKKWTSQKAKKEMEMVMAVISYIRNVRGENNVPPSKMISATLVAKDEKVRQILEEEKKSIESLAKVKLTIRHPEPAGRGIQIRLDPSVASLPQDDKVGDLIGGTVGFADIFIPMTDLFNKEEEKKRLEKELAKIEADMIVVGQRLESSSFMDRAPANIVQKEKDRFNELKLKKEKLEESLRKII